MNSLNNNVPSLGKASIIGIFLYAATGAIDTASANPVTSFTTAISETLVFHFFLLLFLFLYLLYFHLHL